MRDLSVKAMAIVAGTAMALVAGCSEAPKAPAAETTATTDPLVAARSLFTAQDKISLYRLYTGPDQRSHVETIELDPRTYNEGRQWAQASATRMVIGGMPHGLVGDYHPAMRRSVLIPMQGTIVVDVGDGKEYRVEPGNMVLAEDRTGKGHISTCDAPDTSQCLIMMINLADGEEGLQAGFATPPTKPNYSDPAKMAEWEEKNRS